MTDQYRGSSRQSYQNKMGYFQNRSTEFAIIGGGLLGSAVTYYLAKAGRQATLIERGSICSEASGANAGSLHLQIYIHPSWDSTYLDRIRPTVELHRQAALHWQTLEVELSTDLGVRLGGGLMVAETPDQFELLRRKVALENSMGLETQLVGSRQMMDIAPYLATHLIGADYLPKEGFANPLLVGPAFTQRAVQYGAQILTGTEVRTIVPKPRGGFIIGTSQGDLGAARIINSAGAWASQIARMVGLKFPTQGAVAQVSVTEACEPIMHGQLIQHVGRGLTLKQSPRGNFIIGGGWRGSYESATGRKLPLRDSIVGNIWVAASTVPSLRQVHLMRSWGGMGSWTMDGLPAIGESMRVRDFFMLHCNLGFTLGTVAARALAEKIMTGKASVELEIYDPDRF